MSSITFAVPAAFSAAECAAIAALGDAAPAANAPVWTDLGYAVDARCTQRVDHASGPRRRDRLAVRPARRPCSPKPRPRSALAVGPIAEPVQILRYDTGGHFQRWHTDGGLDRKDARLISVSVELSDVRDYEGGLLEVAPDLVGRPRELPRARRDVLPPRRRCTM